LLQKGHKTFCTLFVARSISLSFPFIIDFLMGGKMNDQQNSQLERLLWGLDDLARAMGVDRRTVERMEAAGAIGPVRIKLPGRLVRFLADECGAWILARCPARDLWQQRDGLEVRRHVQKTLEK
jgi:predicted DNA-binding transcriptional regulator AlpA